VRAQDPVAVFGNFCGGSALCVFVGLASVYEKHVGVVLHVKLHTHSCPTLCVCMFVCIYIYVYVYICIYVYMCICVYVYIYICVCVYVCTYIRVSG